MIIKKPTLLLFLVIFVFMSACGREQTSQLIDLHRQFGLVIGKMEDQIDLIQLPGEPFRQTIDMVMKKGLFFIGNGAALTGQAFGVDQVPVVKRQGLPAYDPRAVKGMGVTYATSPMGADHTAGYSVAMNILKVGGFTDPLKPEGQADISRGLQVATVVLDSAGLCLFVAFATLDIPEGFDAIPKMINARYGLNLSTDDLLQQGQALLRLEQEFNRAAGLTAQDDRLPDFFRNKPLAPHNVVFDVPDADLDSVLAF